MYAPAAQTSAQRPAQSRPNVRRLALIGLVWLACLLRWYAPDLVPYTYDDASQIAIAGSVGGNPWAESGHYPLLSGGTTLGVQRSALHAYVLALFLGLGGLVEAAVWGIGALGVLAVALVYRLGRRMADSRVGIWAALFMAANPWLVYHDRRLWAHIYTVLSVLLLYVAWRVIVDRRWRAAVWMLPVLAVQTLVHTLGAVQGVAVLGAFLSLPRAWLSRWAGAGALLALLLLIPYAWALADTQPHLVAGVLNGNGSPAASAPAADTNTDTNIDANGQTSGPADTVKLAPRLRNLLRTNHWTLLNHLVTGTGFSSTVGRQETGQLWWTLGRNVALPIMWLLVGAGLLRLVVDLFRPLRSAGARLILLWMALPLLLYGVQPVRIAFQYWTVLLPLPALLAGLGVDALRTWLVTWDVRLPLRNALAWLPLSGALIVAVIWLGSYSTVQTLRATGEAGTPLRFWRAGIAQAEAEAAQAGTQEIRFAVSGIDPAFDGEAAAVATLIGNPPYARFVDPPAAQDAPPAILLNYSRPSLYYWTIDAPAAEAALGQWGERIWQGDPRAGEPPARLFRLPSYVDLGLAVTPLDAPPFDMGLQLLAADFPAQPTAGTPQTYTLIWRVLEPPPEARTRDFTAFNHILDANGAMVSQVDGLALLSRDWWPNDVLVQSYTLALPPGDLVWRTGLYSRVDGERAYTPDWQDSVEIPFSVAGE